MQNYLFWVFVEFVIALSIFGAGKATRLNSAVGSGIVGMVVCFMLITILILEQIVERISGS